MEFILIFRYETLHTSSSPNRFITALAFPFGSDDPLKDEMVGI